MKFEVHKPINAVLSYLVDTTKFVSVHPVITKLEPKGEDNYMVYETLKVGFIPISFTYPVEIKFDEQKGIVNYKAIVKRMVQIEMSFQLSSLGNQTKILETITFKSIFPVKFVMGEIFKKQHSLLFKNIEKALD